MIQKRPNWKKCSGQSTHSSIHNSLNFKPFGPADVVSVQVGMKVVAKYGESRVHLKIIKILEKEKDFEAEIEYFEPINIAINVASPNDLKEGETVLIDREHICAFFEKD